VSIEVCLEGVPDVARSEAVEQIGEAIVVAVEGTERFAEEGLESAVVPLHPGLEVVEAMVALGGEEEQPDSEDLTAGEWAAPTRRRWEVLVQQGDELKPLEAGPQHRQIADGFDLQEARLGSVHPYGLDRRIVSKRPSRKSEP